jgi:hypothetical protein
MTYRNKSLTALIDRPCPLSREDLIWLAGFMNGEGCFTIVKVNSRGYLVYRPDIAVVNTNMEVMKEVQIMFYSFGLVGAREWTPSDSNKNYKTAYTVKLASMSACHFMCKTLQEFLRVKRPQSLLLIKWIEYRFKKIQDAGKTTIGYDKIEDMWYEEMRLLNRKGNKPQLENINQIPMDLYGKYRKEIVNVQ